MGKLGLVVLSIIVVLLISGCTQSDQKPTNSKVNQPATPQDDLSISAEFKSKAGRILELNTEFRTKLASILDKKMK